MIKEMKAVTRNKYQELIQKGASAVLEMGTIHLQEGSLLEEQLRDEKDDVECAIDSVPCSRLYFIVIYLSNNQVQRLMNCPHVYFMYLNLTIQVKE